MISHHDWKRYWIPAVSEANGAPSASQVDAGDRRTTEQLRHSRCTVMLGLPGMGKTTEMQVLSRLAEHEGAFADFVSLGRLASSAELEQILLTSAGRRVWLAGGRWAIHLDGFDEAVVEHDELIASIGRSLRMIEADLDGLDPAHIAARQSALTMRISCRAAEWPRSLSADLEALFEGSFEVVQLAELTDEDVEAAAAGTGIAAPDWRQVLDDLEMLDADALARRPITLQMLLSVYAQTGEVPRQQVPLYRRGILAILEEANALRRRKKIIGRLETSARMVVAARIAAAMIFANATSISLSAQADGGSTEAVLVAEIAGGYEAIRDESFPVGEADIIELLRTGLFQPLSDTKFTWTHRTFAEFLAASYLDQHGLSTEQLLEFLSSSNDPKKRIPPQLHEVTAWVASMRPDFFAALIVRQPAILLRSDVAAASAEDRSSLVRQLLVEFDQSRLFDTDWDLRRRYAKLRHPTLADDLRPYIGGQERSIMARRAAIQMAVECQETSLAPNLVALALDTSDAVPLRTEAVIAVGRIAPAPTRSELKPLALPGDPVDHEDELRGWSLAALWPDHISFTELLTALTPRKRENLLGGYWRFQRELKLHLNAKEAVEAVRWVRERAAALEDKHDYSEEELQVVLLTAAWKQAGDTAVLDAFAEFGRAASVGEFSRLIHSPRFESFVAAYGSGEAEWRHRLAKRVLEDLARDDKSARLSIYGQWPLVIPADIPWLLSELSNTTSDLPEAVIIEAIIALLFVGGIKERDDVWEAARDTPALGEALDRAFTTSLESEFARLQRKARRTEPNGEAAKFNLVDEARRRLGRAPEHVDEWWRFNLLFYADDQGHSNGGEFDMDLTGQPLWRKLSTNEQRAVVEWASAYIDRGHGSSRRWLGTATFFRPAAAAYRALRLLLTADIQRLHDLPSSAWATWAHAILAVPSNDAADDEAARVDLVGRAYRAAPRELLGALARLLVRPSDGHSVRKVLRRLDKAFDDRIGEFLWTFAQRPKAPSAARLDVLDFLIARNFTRARQAMVDEFASGLSGKGLGLDKDDLVKLAGNFVFAFPSETWASFRNLADPTLARDIYLAAHSQHGLGSFRPDALSEAQLRDLYLWSHAEFGAEVDEDEDVARWVGPLDQVQHTQRAILRSLVQRGTAAAVEAVRDIAAALPEELWLKWQLDEAETAFQTRAWRSPSAADVLDRIASYGIARPVRSAKAALERSAEELRSVLEASEGDARTNVDLVAEAEITPAVAPPRPSLNILCVASEWSSAHGGLSTLNRELCIALGAEGHQVACLVPEASDAEIAAAAECRVRLITCHQDAGVNGLDRLFLLPYAELRKLGAQVVIGHDHITGPAAHNIARRVLEVPYVHFVHTIPDEIEAYKSRNLYKSLARGAAKADVQLKQCKQADLIVGVGPHIYSEIWSKVGATPRVVELRPGLSPTLMNIKKNAGMLPISVLFQGRLEHSHLKGAPLAFAATKRVRMHPSTQPWARPHLVMRGFDEQEFEEQCGALGDEQSIQQFVRPRFFTTDDTSLDADLNSASLLLMPSKKEGFGLVALEAIAAGIPVLISAQSGIAQLLHMDPQISAAIDPKAAKLAVCDVEGETEEAVEIAWAAQMMTILSNRKEAFARADRLRKDLARVLTWRAAALALADELARL